MGDDVLVSYFTIEDFMKQLFSFRSLVTILIVFTTASSLMMCSRSNSEHPALPVVRVGYVPFNNCLPFFVAMDRGYFAAQGLNVEAIRFNNSTDVLNALIGGHLDATAGIAFSSYWSVEQESPGLLKVFLPNYETPEFPFSDLLVPANSPITDVSQLRGKKIGTYTGTSQLLYLRLYLKNIGLIPDRDVSTMQVGSELQIQALVSGQYDALFTIEPYCTIAVKSGAARVLVSSPRTKNILNPFWAGGPAVTAKYLHDNPQAVAALYNGMAHAVQFTRDSVLPARQALLKYTPVDSVVAATSGIYQFVLMNETMSMTAMQQLADMMTAEGVLRKHVDVQSLLLTPKDLSL